MPAKNELLVMAGVIVGVMVIHRHYQFKKIDSLRIKAGEMQQPGNKAVILQNVLLVSGIIGASTFLYYGLKT